MSDSKPRFDLVGSPAMTRAPLWADLAPDQRAGIEDAFRVWAFRWGHAVIFANHESEIRFIKALAYSAKPIRDYDRLARWWFRRSTDEGRSERDRMVVVLRRKRRLSFGDIGRIVGIDTKTALDICKAAGLPEFQAKRRAGCGREPSPEDLAEIEREMGQAEAVSAATAEAR